MNSAVRSHRTLLRSCVFLRMFHLKRIPIVDESRHAAASTNDRIAALESRLRWQVRMTGAVIVVVLMVFVLGAGPGGFEEIKARRFVVSDEEDNPRVLLTSHGGATVLSMFDASGTTRARFSVLEDGHPEITLLDKSGQTMIRLAEREGAVQLLLEDGRGLGKIIVGQTNNQFGIDVSDSSGESGVRLRSQPEQPQVAVVGADDGGVVQIFAHADKSGLSISDHSGQPGAILTMLENLRPLLLLQGQQKRTLVVPQENVPLRPANQAATNPALPQQ